ncbi:hypothetical protein DSECCO2_570460 [anaerobic digester metagenome]
MLGPKQLTGAVTRDVFNDIDAFASAVIAFTGVALGIFIGEYRAHRGHNRRRDQVFTRNQFNVALLALEFLGHRLADLGVGLCNKSNRIHHFAVHWLFPFPLFRDMMTV